MWRHICYNKIRPVVLMVHSVVLLSFLCIESGRRSYNMAAFFMPVGFTCDSTHAIIIQAGNETTPAIIMSDR